MANAQTSTGQSSESSSGEKNHDAYVELVALARKGVSQTQFLRDALMLIAKHFASPYSAMHVRYASEVVQHDWHTGPTDPAFWKPSVQQYLTECLAEPRPQARLLQAKGGNTKVALLATPIFDPSGPAIGAVALVLAPMNQDELPSRLATLEAMTRFVSVTVEFLGAAHDRNNLTSAQRTTSTTNADRALAQASRYRSTEELAFALTNEICNKMGAEQVALGIVKHDRIRVLSISGMDEIKHQSPGVSSMRAAMEECLDASTMIVYQASAEWSDQQNDSSTYRLHKQWHTATGGDAVASIPLSAGEETVAVVSIRRRPSDPYKPGQLDEVRTRIEPFGGSLVMTQRAGRSLPRHAIDKLHQSIAALRQPGRIGAQVMALIALLGTITFFFGSMNYDLRVPAVLTPASLRHVAAPFQAVLSSAIAMEGKRVTQGDILCELDHGMLDQQRSELRAELTVIEHRIDRALADNIPVEAQLAQAEKKLILTKLDIVESRIEQAVVRAPISGMIVQGDLRKSIGSVIAQGDPLFAIAPLNEWHLELQVPEQSAAELIVQQAGVFSTFASPENVHAFQVHSIYGETQQRANRNVIIAEATVETKGGWVRPGMEGVARVRVGSRRIWWITLHRMIDYMRLYY